MSGFKLLGLILLVAGWMACGGAEEKKPAVEVESGVVKKAHQQLLIFFGNSLTAGYGLDPEEAFPARTQQKIDSLGLGFEVINAGLSGETSAGGLTRIDWIL